MIIRFRNKQTSLCEVERTGMALKFACTHCIELLDQKKTFPFLKKRFTVQPMESGANESVLCEHPFDGRRSDLRIIQCRWSFPHFLQLKLTEKIPRLFI